MIDPTTGKMLDNITCPRCRFRHPAEWTCVMASAIAKAPRAQRSRRTGKLICGCKRGYASELDGMCFTCRGGVPAREALDFQPRK